MDFFDERVLAVLKDGKPRSFSTLLSEVSFSHNTLQQHLDRLIARGLAGKEKMASNSLEDPNSPINVRFRDVHLAKVAWPQIVFKCKNTMIQMDEPCYQAEHFRAWR